LNLTPHTRYCQSFSAAPTAVCLLFLWIFTPFLIRPALSAETLYVTPQAEIPLRNGKGSGYRILAVVYDGDKVTLLEDDGTWAKVRTAGGKEGWTLKRYLSRDVPLQGVVTSLKARGTELQKQTEELKAKEAHASELSAQCERDLDACISARDGLSADYDALRADSTDVVNIKQALADGEQELQKVRQRLAEMEQENQHLRNNERIRWFLAGGGVLVIGWILGMIMGRTRRHRPSLL
jgi:SH3 domain protein